MDLPDFNGLTNEEVVSLVKKAIAETLQSRAGLLCIRFKHLLPLKL